MRLAYAPLDRLALDDYALVPREYTRTQRCTQCGGAFREAENLGQLRCRLHPGVRIVDGGVPLYTCCQARPSDAHWPGCRAADHFARDLPWHDEEARRAALLDEAMLAVPLVLFERGGLLPPSVWLYRWPLGGGALSREQRIRQEAEKRRVVRFTLDDREKTLAVSAVLADLDEWARDCAFFQTQATRSDAAGQRRRALRERGESQWPSSLGRDDDDDGARDAMIVPFLVLRRL